MEAKVDGFIVPNMQTWYRQSSFLCTPDNGLLYHSRSDVNYIAQLSKEHMPKQRIINVRAMIKSIACSPDWSERREFATFDENNQLLLWDLDQAAAVKGHKGHMYKLSQRQGNWQNTDVTSAVCFTQTKKIISVDHSVMIIYCLVADSYKIYADFFRSNDTVVLLSPCPTDRYIFAAGMKNGLIQLFSIQDMTILHSMRGHDKEIVSIDWMQVPVWPERSSISWRRKEERPKKEARKKKTAKEETDDGKRDVAPVVDSGDIFDIYDYNENEEEFGTIIDRQTSSYDQRDKFRDKVHTTEGFNFLEECQNLKEDLKKAQQEQEEGGDDSVLPDDVENAHEVNTDDENELDEAEKLRDFIIVDGEGEEKQGSEEDADELNGAVMKTVLVSGSRENNIFFWDYDEGIQIDKVVMPHNQMNKRVCSTTFITVVWLNATKIVANSISGHICDWAVSFYFRDNRIRLETKQNQFRYPVEAVIYVTKARGAIGDYDPKADYVWCLSIYRKIVGVLASDKPEIVADLACLPSGNMCIEENPMESTVLAVGCTDRKLVTLNLASMAYNEVCCAPFANNIRSKVTALDWHPERENVIAFGTSEGRIGVLDTNSQNNVPIILNSFLSTDVYTLKWCELVDEDQRKSIVLFAAGKSKMAYYKKIGPGKHEIFEQRKFGTVSSVSSCEQYLFVGTQDGFVFVNDLSKNMEQLYHRSVAHRYICSMRFKGKVLAVASNESNIRLIDFNEGFDDKISSNITLLEGHTEAVCCVRWGHGESKLLVSGSFDNTVRVWDSTNSSCLALFQSVDSVFCAIFSPIHDNVIIFSGKGTTLAFIDYTKHAVADKLPEGTTTKVKIPTKWATSEDRSDKKAQREKKRAGKPLQRLERSLDSLNISDKSEETLPLAMANGHASKVSPSKAEDSQPMASHSQPMKPITEINDLVAQIQEIKIKEIKPVQLRTNIPTTFHLTNREINKPTDVLSCIIKLANFEEPNEEEPTDDQPEVVADQQTPDTGKRYFNEKLFMTESDLRELIDQETKNHHDAQTASIGTILLPQIGFRLKDEIVERIKAKTLTDQLVALAPSISYRFWQVCCEAYAYQSLEKQYTLAAIPYLLASHKIDEAIENLCKNKFFREAWAICKLRKARDDPIREKVCADWAQYLEGVGNLEGAALIWTASKKYKNAVAVLSKRKEITEDIQRAIEVLNEKLQQAAAENPET